MSQFLPIVSVNDNPDFYGFWPIVCRAWQKFFQVTPKLAFVTSRPETDQLVVRMREHGPVQLYPVAPGAPSHNQGMLARFYLAAQQGKTEVTIEDIDTVPLQETFITRVLQQRAPGTMLLVGSEVYARTKDAGKFPISQMTGEGYLFNRLFSVGRLSYVEWIALLLKHKERFDHQENPRNALPDGNQRFSDESLIRCWLETTHKGFPFTAIRRGVNVHRDWIDRTWWAVDQDKLTAGRYICCNFRRPMFMNNPAGIEELLFYLTQPKGGVVWLGKTEEEDERIWKNLREFQQAHKE